MSARMSAALAKSKLTSAGSMAIYPSSSRRRRSSVLIAQISSSAARKTQEIADQMGDLFANVVWHIISALPTACPWLAYGQIPLGPMSQVPSAQWQFCRPQRLYVSTNVPRRTSSIGGKPRAIRRRRLRSAGGGKILDVHRTNHSSVRNKSKSEFIGQPRDCSWREYRGAQVSATKPKASMSNRAPPPELFSSGDAQSVHSRGIANEPRSTWRRLSVSIPETWGPSSNEPLPTQGMNG